MVREKDIDAADWIDQDLLTREEAAERLVDEMVKLRARKNELESSAGDDPADTASLTLVTSRLAAMEKAHKSL